MTTILPVAYQLFGAVHPGFSNVAASSAWNYLQTANTSSTKSFRLRTDYTDPESELLSFLAIQRAWFIPVWVPRDAKVRCIWSAYMGPDVSTIHSMGELEIPGYSGPTSGHIDVKSGLETAIAAGYDFFVGWQVWDAGPNLATWYEARLEIDWIVAA